MRIQYKKILIIIVLLWISLNCPAIAVGGTGSNPSGQSNGVAGSGTGTDPGSSSANPAIASYSLSSSSTPTPEANFNTNITSTRGKVNRGDTTSVNYTTNFVGNLAGKFIIIGLPIEFSNVKIVAHSRDFDYDPNKRKITVFCDIPTSKNLIYINYSAEISLAAREGKVHIDPMNRSFIDYSIKPSRDPTGKGCCIEIENNRPDAPLLEIDGGEKKSRIDIFFNETKFLNYKGHDRENNNYTWQLLCDGNVMPNSTRVKVSDKGKYTFLAAHVGINHLKVRLFDTEGAINDSNEVIITVLPISEEEYTKREFSKLILIILLIAFMMFVGSLLRYVSKFWYTPVIAFIVWILITLLFPSLRQVAYFEILFYGVLLFVAAYFIF